MKSALATSSKSPPMAEMNSVFVMRPSFVRKMWSMILSSYISLKSAGNYLMSCSTLGCVHSLFSLIKLRLVSLDRCIYLK